MSRTQCDKMAGKGSLKRDLNFPFDFFPSIHLQLSLDQSLFWRSQFSLKSSKKIVGGVKGTDKESGDRPCASATTAILACEAWQFWWGAQTSKGARGRWKCEEIGAGATRRLLYFSWLRRLFARAFAASPLSIAPDETAMLRRLLQYNIFPALEIY